LARRRRTVEERVEEFVARVASEFGVPPPKVKVVHGLKYTCGCMGYYDDVEKRIGLDAESGVNLITVLHELAHHIQHTKLGLTIDKVEAELGKKHCDRSFEAEAKAFAAFYRDYFKGLWEKIVGW
jgi:hypothetical protein